jgi:achilleol B synthase
MRNKPSGIFKFISTCLNMFVEPVLNYWPLKKLRERALNHILEHIHYEDETTQYIGLCPVPKVLYTIIILPYSFLWSNAGNHIVLL